MMRTSRLTRATEDLRQQLEIWREAHRPPTPIPSEIWKKAVELAEELGLAETARALRLDYGALKKRVVGTESAMPAGPPSTAQFIEWMPSLSGGISQCVMEVDSPSGARLRVEMGSIAPSGLASILREFAE